MSDLFSPTGRVLLEEVPLDGAYRLRLDSLLGLIDHFSTEIDRFAGTAEKCLAAHPGYVAIQQIPGVGPVTAAIFVAEIGDAGRFPGSAQLCSWAGLTPRHRESDTHVARGHITKPGSRLVRWAAVEAVGRQRGATPICAYHHRIAARRNNTSIGRVAAARKLLTLVYYRAQGRRDPRPRPTRVRPPAQPDASSY